MSPDFIATNILCMCPINMSYKYNKFPSMLPFQGNVTKHLWSGQPKVFQSSMNASAV